MQKLAVHIHESEGPVEYFRITEEKFERALRSHPELRERLNVTFSTSSTELLASVSDAEVLVIGNVDFYEIAARARRLKWVQTIFAGVEDLVCHVPSTVLLTNASGVHAAKAGEFVVGAVILLNTRLPHILTNQAHKRWEKIFRPGLQNQSALVLGTGAIGAEVARRLKAFGMRVTGVSRSGATRRNFDYVYAPSQLAEALPDASYLISTLPSTPETRGIIGASQIDLLKPGASVISVGRGQVFDQKALAEALEREHLSGAVLDVFETEPLPSNSSLWTTKNLIIVPHCGIDDIDSYLPALLDIFLKNVKRYLKGQPLQNKVDLVRGY